MNTISIICDDFDDVSEDSLQGIEAAMADMPFGRNAGTGGSAVAKDKRNKKYIRIEDIDIDKVKPQINKNIQSILSLIDEEQFTNKNYEVSELEFTLSIQGETKVSLFSAISAGVSAHSGITVRIRKKTNQ